MSDVKVYEGLFCWFCEMGPFIAAGWTRDEAIDAWVQKVKDTGSPGAFNERAALKIAKELKKIFQRHGWI